MTTTNPLGDTLAAGAAHIVDRTWKSLLGIGIASIILGLIALIWPGPTIIVAAVVFGIYLLVSGILQIVATFGAPDVSGGWRLLTFIIGVLTLILGFIALRHLGESIVLLAIWIGIGWIFRGVASISVYVGTPGLPGRGLGIFLGVITVIAGIVLLVSPIESIGVLTVVIGILLLVVGILEVIDAFSLRSAANKAFSSN